MSEFFQYKKGRSFSILQRNFSYIGMFCWLTALMVLILSSCSPLYLVNALSTESDSVAVFHKSYGKEKRQQLDIFIPEKTVAGSPVVVFFYGGSWKRGEKGKYRFVGDSLGGKGYTTVIPDYRLYPEVTFPAFVEDGAKVLAWVRENVEQARNGVVVMGHSAGAHTAALIALDQRYLEQAGQPSSIIRGMIGLAGPYGFNPMKYKSTRPIFADVEVIEKTMPVTFACSAKSPLLLFHGADDSTVIPENSRELKRRVEECAGNVKYVELDDIGHFSILLGLSDSFLEDNTIQLSIEEFLQSLSRQSG
jgi:acetyl esterase/lipase